MYVKTLTHLSIKKMTKRVIKLIIGDGIINVSMTFTGGVDHKLKSKLNESITSIGVGVRDIKWDPYSKHMTIDMKHLEIVKKIIMEHYPQSSIILV